MYKYLVLCLSLMIVGCDQQTESGKTPTQIEQQPTSEQKIEKFPVIQPKTKLIQPFKTCKTCTKFEIISLKTSTSWINDWIEQQQTDIVLEQIPEKFRGKPEKKLKKVANLYDQASKKWLREFELNQPYELKLETLFQYQHGPYILLRLRMDTEQEGVEIKDRVYFKVLDRELKKSVYLKDILQASQLKTMDQWVQHEYQIMLKQQDKMFQKQFPQQLKWENAEWFFDQQGIGLHYKTNEIMKQSPQFDIYLTSEQTQKVLKPEVYGHMFN